MKRELGMRLHSASCACLVGRGALECKCQVSILENEECANASILNYSLDKYLEHLVRKTLRVLKERTGFQSPGVGKQTLVLDAQIKN